MTVGVNNAAIVRLKSAERIDLAMKNKVITVNNKNKGVHLCAFPFILFSSFIPQNKAGGPGSPGRSANSLSFRKDHDLTPPSAPRGNWSTAQGDLLSQDPAYGHKSWGISEPIWARGRPELVSWAPMTLPDRREASGLPRGQPARQQTGNPRIYR